MIAASCDLGTNTFRLLIADVGKGSLRPVLVERAITRLGGGALGPGALPGAVPVIQPEAMARARQALRVFKRAIDGHRPERIEAVATHIVRTASNGDDIVRLVREELGCMLRVISPEEEAHLALLGARHALGRTDRLLLVDVGGGSTEYALCRAPDDVAVISADLGVVSLTERYVGTDPPSPDDIAGLVAHIEKRLGGVYAGLKEKGLDPLQTVLAGTAGTVTTLAMMDMGLREYLPERINGYVLHREGVEALCGKLAGMKTGDRLALPGLEKGREDVIVAGALVVSRTLAALGYRRIVVSDGGILEGILLDREEMRV